MTFRLFSYDLLMMLDIGACRDTSAHPLLSTNGTTTADMTADMNVKQLPF